MIPVPCNGCRRCCIDDAIRILPEEDASQWRTEPHFRISFRISGARQLAHRANGECVYLGPDGCTIHESKPLMCKRMDCRAIALRFTYTQARQLHASGKIRFGIWRRGKELLKELRDAKAVA